MNNIYLIGFMGAGKTAVAHTLEEKTLRKRYDTDDMIVEREGKPVSLIFAQDGEDYFRRVEREVIASLTPIENAIVSCGGGVIKSEENRKELKRGGKVIFLSATPETVLDRVSRNNRRPLLEGHKNLSDIKKMMDERMMLYEKAYDIRIEVDDKSLEEISDEILKKIAILTDKNAT